MEVVLGVISSISSCSDKYWIESVWIRGGILIEGIPFGVDQDPTGGYEHQ